EETSRILNFYRETGDQEALDLLVASNMGFVGCFVKRHLNSGVEYDDLKSAGTIGLINAINKFNVEKPIEAFSTYISIAIDNQIKMEIKKSNKHSGVMSLDAPIGHNKDGDEMTIEDIVGTDEEQLFNDVISGLKVDIVREALQSLTYREQQIILLRYGLDDAHRKTLEEVAEMFGCSKTPILKQEQKALVKMRHPKNTRKLKDFLDD
ncbi:MAG: sigma-70 family RNA polymerase sigma factor, partial [Bacteroidales bacterium]|nr:sigma-70 family RNA polymerase sigma factor [Bacteroidales bacterium]